jgi:hypothetical protein
MVCIKLSKITAALAAEAYERPAAILVRLYTHVKRAK